MRAENAPTRRTALKLGCAALFVPQIARAAGTGALSGRAFGTDWRVVAGDERDLAGLRPRIESLFQAIDLRFSPWRDDSEITRFNRGPAGKSPADPQLSRVTGAAIEIASRSEGAFDPTVGPLVARWGFGPLADGGTPDWRGIDVGAGWIEKARADLTLDLCGIAKGWALDQAVALLRAEGVQAALVEIGGEFAALGHHPDGRDWHVAVNAPVPGRPPPAVFRLAPDLTIATSGSREQSYVLDGRLYSHIIDPRTGAPVSGGLRSVTVLDQDAMMADAWATALFAAGDVTGPDIAATLGIPALFLIEGASGPRQIKTGPVEEVIL